MGFARGVIFLTLVIGGMVQTSRSDASQTYKTAKVNEEAAGIVLVLINASVFIALAIVFFLNWSKAEIREYFKRCFERQGSTVQQQESTAAGGYLTVDADDEAGAARKGGSVKKGGNGGSIKKPGSTKGSKKGGSIKGSVKKKGGSTKKAGKPSGKGSQKNSGSAASPYADDAVVSMAAKAGSSKKKKGSKKQKGSAKQKGSTKGKGKAKTNKPVENDSDEDMGFGQTSSSDDDN